MTHTLLGAGGPIADGLAKELAARNLPFRLVGRKPKPMVGGELVSADLTDRTSTINAVTGSSVVYLLAGLKYDAAVWSVQWPLIMDNVIEACKLANAKLLFFDNIYMYGRVSGAMSEETPDAPCSKKGEIRARIAATLLSEIKAGNLTALIARSADFYGPSAPHGVANILVFDAIARGKKASWLVNADVPHSFTYIPDAVRGVFELATKESAWNQVWHLPTSPDPPTGREFIAIAANEFGVAPKFRILSRPMLKIVGMFDPNVRESYEMLYQSDSAQVFDSSKYAREFGFAGTPYAEGIHQIALSYRRSI